MKTPCPKRITISEELYSKPRFKGNDEVSEEKEKRYREKHPFREVVYIRLDVVRRLLNTKKKKVKVR
jgi:hypothetical protein